jgi:hypothetical protein
MNTQLRQAKDGAHGLTIRDGAKRAGWVIAGVGAALLMTSAASAAPAPGGAVIVNQASLPDLSVSMNAPATVEAYQDSSFTVSVTNSPPSNGLYLNGAGRTVRAHVDLTGMTALSAQSDAGLSCTVSVANPQTPWSVVDCIGTLAYGASTTILVNFRPGTQITTSNTCNGNLYCGQPTYADVSAQYWSGSASERTTSNNRAIERIDNVDCIG